MEHGEDHPSRKHNPEPEDSYSFEDTATSLGFSREQQRDPTMRSFIGLVNQVSNLQIAADDASLSAPFDVTDWPRSETAKQYFEKTSLEPNLRDRYASVELLLRVAEAVLTDGMHGKHPIVEDPNYLQGKLESAVARYGLRVVRDSPTSS